MHLSRSTFLGTADDGQYRLPVTMHVTYCGRQAGAHEVAPEHEATCDDCITALCWEELDRANCESHPGGG